MEEEKTSQSCNNVPVAGGSGVSLLLAMVTCEQLWDLGSLHFASAEFTECFSLPVFLEKIMMTVVRSQAGRQAHSITKLA